MVIDIHTMDNLLYNDNPDTNMVTDINNMDTVS